MRGLLISSLCVGMFATNAVIAQPAALQGVCTVLTPPDTGTLLDYSRDPVGKDQLLRGEQLGPSQGAATVADNRAVFYCSAGEGGSAAEATIYLDAESQFRLGAEAAYRQMQVDLGNAVIFYQSRTGEPLVITAGQSWIGLKQGAILVTVKDGAAKAQAINSGTEAALFAGAVPAVDPRSATGGQAIAVDSGAAQTARSLMDSLHGRMALEGPSSWLGRAAQGDLTPTATPGVAGKPGAAQDFGNVQVRSPQQEAGTSFQVSTVAGAVATILPPVNAGVLNTTAQVSIVQSLLSSQSPGSVVVGDRLGRARTVGIPQPNNLIFNFAVTPPLRLSQTRRGG